MKGKIKKILSRLIDFVFSISSILFIIHIEKLYASENAEAALLKKVSLSFTKNTVTLLDLDYPRKVS